MTPFDIGVLRYHLKIRLEEIQSSLVHREDLRAERLPDEVDNRVSRGSREEEAARFTRLTFEASEITTALRKSEEDFGICEVCGEEIGIARLTARPDTRLCKRDKEREEREGK